VTDTALPSAPDRSMSGSAVPATRRIGLRTVTTLLPWIALAAAAIYVSKGSAYLLTVGTVTAIWAVLALGLNFIMGYSGLINLGLGAFYALGAYGSAILDTEHDLSPWVGLLVFPVVAFVAALLIGPAVLRTRGLHFAVATLGIGIIVSDVLENWLTVTKGPIGIAGIRRPGTIDVGVFTIDPSENVGFFVLCVLLLAVVLVIATVYHRSRLARVLVATHDDELLATSLGFRITRQKVIAFALSAGVAALAGVMYAWFIRYISPPPFAFFAASFPAFVLVAVGGPGTVWGPVIGAAFLTGFPEFLEVEPNTQNVIYGAVLLIVIVALPKGLGPSVIRLVRTATRRGRGTQQSPLTETGAHP
jgi:branched-chain amino acid transport system permease protein